MEATSRGGAQEDSKKETFSVSAPAITMPKGGGAIRGIGEKFATNPVTGTASLNVPIYTSPGRAGFGPQLALSYDSGAGNGPFGFGWSLSTPAITRRTDKGLPQYFDAQESDIFVLSGAEDLVSVLVNQSGRWERQVLDSPASEPGYSVRRYRPRTEGLFARVERWTNKVTGISHWRSISRDNITTLYGKRADARISDPLDPTRVFSWLICESYDDKGNAVVYQYKAEDSANVDPAAPCERNRLLAGNFAQRYLKSVRYGNRTPREVGEELTTRDDWLFEVTFDYGEHDEAAPSTKELRSWPGRQDPFSLSRATFDVRTYRLCRRILMFHHFPDQLGGTRDYLVRSTDLEYKEGAVASFVASATQSGYTRQPDGSYFKKSLPKLQFTYSEARIDETVHEVDAESIKNLPYGVDDKQYQWVDLESEGLSGVLSEQADAWYYKRNLGNGTFGKSELVAPKPWPSALSGGRQQLLDLAGEGHLELVQFDGPLAGFHERRADGGWERFTRFKSLPSIDTRGPNVRFVDVTGDGHADILISEETVFTWYESRAKEGFGPARRAPRVWDEEKGPKLVFSDPTQSIFIADMSGDGLADIVRIRYDEVCYWPNLGYGRFGAKVAMGNPPLFESAEQFDPKRILLADIDGSGNTDIIYAGRQAISVYLNQSGNSWSPAQVLSHYPRTDSLKTLGVTDLLGNGTACLVWSSSLASDVRQPLRYIDLMGGQKPHLLLSTSNNLGAETEVHYVAATQFYLEDRRTGRPWVTKLPFPVHVIDRVESRDLVSKTTLVSTYRYRHGYFDGVEREFRGFAYVEQRDAESVVGEFALPPVVTKTWFHTGALLEGPQLEAYLKAPANQEYFTADAQAVFLPDSELPSDLSFDGLREAARALRGSILRQEVYADDGTVRAALPFSCSERSYRLSLLQPTGPNRHAVFFSHPKEALEYHYERQPADPRLNHTVTLKVDEFGNVLESLAIGYPRRAPSFDEQKRALATLTEGQYTNAVLEDDAYRVPLPFEVKTFEFSAPTLKGATPLGFAVLEALTASAAEISYESQPTPGQVQKRLIEQVRTLYRKNDLSAFLPIGKLESMALPGESYKLALTPGLLDVFQSKASRAELNSILLGADAGYRALDGATPLWLASGRTFYSAIFGDSSQQELAFARAHFFLPHRFQDPFGNQTVTAYDGQYSLLLVSSRDPVGNEIIADQDYRVLQPRMITDPNGNRSEARFDALGMLVGTALRGKATGLLEGDSFDDFTTDLSAAQVTQFFDAADPRSLAVTHLGSATARIVYDLERVPACAASVMRETHLSALAQGQTSKVQLHFVYSDGFGREAQTKLQAEPGPADPNDPSSAQLDPRWVGTGTKVYNNKGKPVRQYEPFFSPNPGFGVEKTGVSSTLLYDPVVRVVATLNPNHTFTKVVFDAWQQTTWDVNDTVTFDPKTDPDAGEFFGRLPDAEYLPTWFQQRTGGALGPEEKAAADKAAAHADTPTIVHFDSLGRAFLSIADNGKDPSGNARQFLTRTTLDIEGNQRQVTDALGRVVMRYDYDMLGTRIHQASMEAGERWMLNDVTGKPIRAWGSRKYALRTEYDALRRPLRSFVQGGDPGDPNARVFAQEITFEQTIYGDSADTGLSDLQRRQANLRGKLFRHFDGAGVVTSDQYDFKGNPLNSSRQFASDYKNALDWSKSPALENETFSSSTTYDALNRPSSVTAPDKSVYRPGFNEANLLNQVDVNLRGAQQNAQPVWTSFVTNIDYDAKGQRTLIQYGSGAQTNYEYDPATFRLTRLKTARSVAPASLPARILRGAASALGVAAQDVASQIFKNGAVVQDLHYTYDPAGNITQIADAALLTVFHANQQVDPLCTYTYDPIYRLTEATGREHIAQAAFQFSPPDGNYRDYPFAGSTQLNDLQALRNYTELYNYDAVGNFERMIHQAANGNWTRAYTYDEASSLEPTKKSNRLSQTALQTTPGTPAEQNLHDAHGNMTRMAHLPLMQWDFKDQLSASARQVVNAGTPETTFYVYDASGQRARKVTERQNGTRKNERFYLGGFEIYREYGANVTQLTLARETLHVMDDKQRIALVETKTTENGSLIATPSLALRYQLGNHLGSASLELDEVGGLISYEEYLPYGGAAYQAGRSAAEVSLKRYRYTGKERDEETGFGYHGARYYAGWLGRWTSCDPTGLADGLNVYAYVTGNPIRRNDPTGTTGENDYGGTLPDGGTPAPDTTSYLPPPPAEKEPDPPATPPSAPAAPPTPPPSPAATPRSNAARKEPKGEMAFEAMSPAQITEQNNEQILTWELPPEKLPYPDLEYLVVYGIKQSIYKPIKALLLDERPHYLDSSGQVRESSIRPDRSDAIGAFGQIALLFVPVPKIAVASGAETLPLRFSQGTASPAFSAEGSFAGKTIGELAADLRVGSVAASDVPVSYVNLGGPNLIVNTRSSLALMRAGIPQSGWTLLDATATDAAAIQARLLRNGLTVEGTPTLRITGLGRSASSLE